MKLKISSFMSFFLIASAVSLYTDEALSLGANSCHNGGEYQHCGLAILFRSCKPCPANCYCPSRSSADSESCTGWTDISCNGVSQRIESKLSSNISDGSFGIKLCPKDYPNSDPGASSTEGCYYLAQGKKVYNKKTKCEPGRYLPVNSNECSACKTTDRYYCPGTVYLSPSNQKDQGLKKCPENKVPTSDGKSCEISKIECKVGQYLPANSEKCAPCPEGGICFGGKWSMSVVDQGLTDAINVPAGKYLPGNSTTPKECPKSDNRYCPGGDFKISSSNQGIYDCPLNGRTNKTKDGCTVTLSKEQLQYGPNGKNTPGPSQCWLQQDAALFQSCVLGISMDED